MRVYLDNAATTALDKEVVEAMLPYMTEKFGNPSSTHQFGSEVRVAIEQARKTIAKNLNVSPSEIIFTSGGTEANNMALRCSTEFMGIKHAITSPLEHHAVLHTLEDLDKLGKIKLSLVKIDAKGNIDLDHLEELLAGYDGQTLVSLMHANNEIGNLLPIKKVSELCEQYKAIFHTDTVQTMCHYPLDFQATKVHFASCAAHKFHGPKGVGFLYMSADVKIPPFITGGAQERNMRGGTENVYGIVGLGKAFEIAHRDMEKETAHIKELKGYMIGRLQNEFPGVEFNGESGNMDKSLYTVLNVSLPKTDIGEMLLFNLDINGVAASGGSACSSGSDIGSHVLRALGTDMERPAVRFSFCKNTQLQDINYAVDVLKDILKPVTA
jgi:cysteine desulfurase